MLRQSSIKGLKNGLITGISVLAFIACRAQTRRPVANQAAQKSQLTRLGPVEARVTT